MTAITAIEASIENRLAAYEGVRRRAANFLLAHLASDGAIGPVGQGPYYYRVPWALAVVGETAAAMQVLGWIRRNMLTPEGEIRGAISPDAGARRQANTYFEACVAYGAHLLRQYDVSQPAMRFALRSQDPVTGGVYMDRERTGPSDPQLLYLTCQLGMSALLTGHPDAALAAGRFCARLWAEQPDLPRRLHTMYSREGLVTRPPEGVHMRHVVNDGQALQEYHYNGGIAAAFLGRLHAYTGAPEWLAAAQAYQSFSMNSTERQFETKQVCKSAWGAAVLSVLTHNDRYASWLLKMGDWFAREQEPEGYWNNTPYLDPNPTLGSRIVITAEFIVHLDSIIGALAENRAAGG